MVPGREKLFGLNARRASRAVGLTGLLVAGAVLTACGSEERDNQARPPIPAGVSVNVTEDRVVLSPRRVAFGAEVRQQVIENREVDEIHGDPDQPMPVNITIANTTANNIRLEVAGPVRKISQKVTPTGSGSLAAELPTGAYRVRVLGLPDAGQTRLIVGPTRISPQNDLLLP